MHGNDITAAIRTAAANLKNRPEIYIAHSACVVVTNSFTDFAVLFARKSCRLVDRIGASAASHPAEINTTGIRCFSTSTGRKRV